MSVIRIETARPWVAEAACRQTDPEAFFHQEVAVRRQAKRVCLDCPVRLPCLQFALEREDLFGVWGGTDPRERRKLLLARRVR